MSDLVPYTPTEMAIVRDTAVVLTEAKKAATDLQNVIAQKKRPVKFNGEQYLELEDWALAGQFYGYTVKTGDAQQVEIDSVKGAKALAWLLDKEGNTVGGAEAYCMRDEANWKAKPWFQLASMAQTRAASKAFKNRLSWFVVMAGFKPTPAEEMEDVHVVPAAAKPLTHEDIPNSMEMNRLIAEIKEMIATLKAGDETQMDAFLKNVTAWKDKDKNDKWLSFKDLPGIAQRKPEWIRTIHKKTVEAYVREAEGK